MTAGCKKRNLLKLKRLLQHKAYTPRRPPLSKQNVAVAMIKEMSNKGKVEESKSPWTSPIVLEQKNDWSIGYSFEIEILLNVGPEK